MNKWLFCKVACLFLSQEYAAKKPFKYKECFRILNIIGKDPIYYSGIFMFDEKHC